MRRIFFRSCRPAPRPELDLVLDPRFAGAEIDESTAGKRSRIVFRKTLTTTGGKRSDIVFPALIECVPDPPGGAKRRRYRIENDYGKEVCNGDIGTFDDVEESSKCFTVVVG